MNEICKNCNKMFDRRNGLLRYNHTFCSKLCYETYRKADLIKIKCDFCKKDILRKSFKIKHTHNFCNQICRDLFKGNPNIQTKCNECGKLTIKSSHHFKKYKTHFCCKSCSTIYKNKHPRVINRSKLELWLETKLPKLYPNLQFQFNRVDTINSELDIYIPSLKLAFELNGPFHYEPIFGPEKLLYTQNNDQRKFQACLERNIELCILDTSHHRYVKESSSLKYLNMITDIINQKLT